MLFKKIYGYISYIRHQKMNHDEDIFTCGDLNVLTKCYDWAHHFLDEEEDYQSPDDKGTWISYDHHVYQRGTGEDPSNIYHVVWEFASHEEADTWWRKNKKQISERDFKSSMPMELPPETPEIFMETRGVPKLEAWRKELPKSTYIAMYEGPTKDFMHLVQTKASVLHPLFANMIVCNVIFIKDRHVHKVYASYNVLNEPKDPWSPQSVVLSIIQNHIW